MDIREWKFKRDTAFRKQFFVPESFSHPAKMDSQLLIKIVEHYTKVGETILDPMAGSGTTMLACGLGRHCILVELEEKFCKMMRANWEQVRMRPRLGYEMGWCEVVQGDARQLTSLCLNVKQSDVVITSPPYAESQIPPHTAEGEARRLQIAKERGVSPDKVSYLDYTKVDKIITSPPYAGSGFGKSNTQSGNVVNRNQQVVSRNRPSNIAQGQKARQQKYADQIEDNIGNLPYGNIDSIITSPPYEGTLEASSRHTKGGIPGRDKVLGQTGTYATLEDAEIIAGKVSKGFQSPEGIKMIEGLPRGYAQNLDNIGNLKSQSYLEAMALVYAQCFKVLRPQGLMILIVKNFLRNQVEIRLDSDTISLCEKAGFRLRERHYRVLPSQSFWRVIYMKKFPLAPVIDKEHILVFVK